MRLLAAYFGIVVFHEGGRLRFPEMAVKASNFHGGNGLPFRLGCMSWLQGKLLDLEQLNAEKPTMSAKK